MSDRSLAPIAQFVLAERELALPDKVRQMASALPPIPCAGFEMRMDGTDVVDLQQKIRLPEDRALLAAFLADTQTGQRSPAWSRLAAFCAETGSGISAEELWLELDAPTDGAPAALSVFSRIASGTTLPDHSAAAQNIAAQLAFFELALPPAGRRAVEAVLAACRDTAQITFLGMMIDRPGSPIRLIIDNIARDDFAGFLRRAGCGALAGDTQNMADDLFVHADRIRLAIGIHDGFVPLIGLECFVDTMDEISPRWQPLLDHLAASGLATGAAVDQLMAWPAVLMPHQTNSPWPAALMLRALTAPKNHVAWLMAQISHVKLSVDAGGQRSAKAYFGFLEHHNARLPTPELSTHKRDLRAAIAAAADWLIEAQGQSGRWQDFPGFSEGTSDEWVTAYTGAACAASGVARVQPAAAAAWAALAERPRQGWGWNHLQPEDADSTVWALRLAHALGRQNCARAADGLRFLNSHIGADGSVATYRPGSHDAMGLGFAINSAWQSEHVCVSAAAASLPGIRDRLRASLLAAQKPGGSWDGYWWADASYTTAMAGDGLDHDTDPHASAAVDSAADWARQRLSQGGEAALKPFDLALTLRVALLRHAPDHPDIQTAIERLIALRSPDGSWPGSAVLDIPNRDGDIIRAVDTRCVFTTATAFETCARIAAPNTALGRAS